MAGRGWGNSSQARKGPGAHFPGFLFPVDETSRKEAAVSTDSLLEVTMEASAL